MSYVAQILFAGVVYVGFNIYNYVIIPIVGSKALVPQRLPDKAPRLEKLEFVDKLFITLSKLFSIVYVYHAIVFCTTPEYSGMSTSLEPADLLKALAMLPVHLPLLFIIYDFFYTLFHWALHWPPLYPLVHKHHHRQMSPFRGNDDAINVHPFEFISGEYLHLFSLFLLTRIFGPGVHWISFFMFNFIGGALASLNHTRIDMRIPYLFNVWAHDFHHRQPRCNYGQYIMLWDAVFGTFKPAKD